MAFTVVRLRQYLILWVSFNKRINLNNGKFKNLSLVGVCDLGAGD